jgi:small conductance mechanosensitive channel
MLENFNLTNWLNESLLEWALTHGLKIVIIIIVGFIIGRTLHYVIETAVRKAVTPHGFSSKRAEEKRENTIIEILSGSARIVLWVVIFMMVLSELGVNVAPLLAGAGIVGVAVGFGGQYLIRDIITGIFVIWENQFRVGDVVTIGDATGVVESVTLRVTVLRDMNGVVHTIPNGEIKQTSNQTKGFSRINMNIGIGYGDDIEKVEKVVNAVGKALAQDSEWADKIQSAPQFLRVDNFGDSSVDIKILGETKPGEQWAVAGELRKRLKYAFDKEGIEIPFPQQVNHNA